MSDRTPATDKGTADRIEADDGGYWVRLVTKQVLKREGVCMGNCLDSQDYGEHLAGDEDMLADGLWSLRKADGLSHLLVELNDLCATDMRSARIEDALGPKNSQSSGWSIRQLRPLVAAFRVAGSVMQVPEEIALTGEDGRTWRPDKAPQDLRDAVEARRKAELARRANPFGGFSYGRMVVSTPVTERSIIGVEFIGGGSSGFETVSPTGDRCNELPECSDDVVLYRSCPDEPFQALRGDERQAAIQQAINRGILLGHRITFGYPAEETVTVRFGGRPAGFLITNEDRTYKLCLGDLVFPKVIPTSGFGFGNGNTATFRVAPPRGAPSVRFATRPGSGAFPEAAGAVVGSLSPRPGRSG